MMDLELLSVLASGLLPYPADETDRLWKGILINQFHDILPGSSIHEVYEVTKKEYAVMEETIARLAAGAHGRPVRAGDGLTRLQHQGLCRG